MAGLILSNVISKVLFHRDYYGSDSFGRVITQAISLALAIICVALATAVAAPAWSRARRQLGGRLRRRAPGDQAGRSRDG